MQRQQVLGDVSVRVQGDHLNLLSFAADKITGKVRQHCIQGPNGNRLLLWALWYHMLFFLAQDVNSLEDCGKYMQSTRLLWHMIYALEIFICNCI